MDTQVKDNWNAWSDTYYEEEHGDKKTVTAIKEDPKRGFPIAFWPVIERFVLDLRGKKVCVPSSGDNVAAFALHLLGAEVTSLDISENQIANAKKIAEANGWDIAFHCADSMDLSVLADDIFDLVYTSNGVHVWISDLPKMYGHIRRILKPGGHYLFFETHPMGRPFDDTTYDIKIKKPYEDVGPSGEVQTYGWRTMDFVNALIASGLSVCDMQEFHSLREDMTAHNYLYIREDAKQKTNWPGDTFDWRNNPWAALPQCLGMACRK